MNEKYIVEGPSLAKLLRENRIRVARGELSFTPLVDGDENKAEPAVVNDEDNKDIPPVDEKVPTEVENVDAPSEDNQDEEIGDSKEVAPEDSKEVAPEEESKDVAPSEDSKDIPPVETKTPKKSKK